MTNPYVSTIVVEQRHREMVARADTARLARQARGARERRHPAVALRTLADRFVLALRTRAARPRPVEVCPVPRAAQ